MGDHRLPDARRQPRFGFVLDAWAGARPRRRGRGTVRAPGGGGGFGGGGWLATRRGRCRRLGAGRVGDKLLAPFGNALRAPGFIDAQGQIDGLEELRPEAAFAGEGGGDDRVLFYPVQRYGRNRSGNDAVEHPGERVDVGPRALVALARILFGRAVAVAEDDGQRVAGARRSRGAEIDQYRTVVLPPQHDVGRLDVAVQEAGGMDRFHAGQQGHHQREHGRLVPARRPVGQRRLQALPLFVFHHHVAGAVVLEVAKHPHDVRVAEARQGLRLAHEAVLAPRIFGLRFFRIQRHGACEGIAHRHAGGEELLDRHLEIQVAVRRQVGDAEASHAEHGLESVLLQQGSRRQGLGQGLRQFASHGKDPVDVLKSDGQW